MKYNKEINECLSLIGRMEMVKKEVRMPKLNEVYDGTGNNSRPIPMNETNAKRLLDRHSEGGYAIISACRGFDDFGLDNGNPKDAAELSRINRERTRELVNLIQQHGFSYTLAYGGFIENLGLENEEHVYERSVIVYAEKRDGTADPKELFNFAIEMCGKFNQDSVLVKMPDQNPKYYKRDAEVDMEFGDGVTFNDVAQEYFTDLHKNTRNRIKDGSRPTRFSLNECYIAPIPQCYSESHVRAMRGEIFLKR